MAQGWLPPPTNSWDVTDLSQPTGGPQAGGDGGVHAFVAQSKGDGLEAVTRYVTYLSANPEGPSEIHQLKFQFDGGWADSNLSAHQAALIPDQRPVAYLFRAQGTVHVIYLGHALPSSQDPQIQEFWAYQDCLHANDQNCWQANNLTVATGAPSPTSAPPVAYAAEFQQTQHVHYVGTDGHLHELWWKDGWNRNDLTIASGASLARLNTSPAAFVSEAAQTQHVYFIDQDNQLQGIFWKDGNWSPRKLGETPLAAPGSPVGYISDDGVERVSYIGVEGHIHELSFDDAPSLQDPSLETNTSVDDPDAQLAAYSGLEPGTRQIIVIQGGSVQRLSTAGGNWNFSTLIDSNGPESDKSPDDGARPGAFAVPAARQEYVYYPSIDFRVIELAGPPLQIIER